MSVDSVRKRLEAAAPGPWEAYDANGGEQRPMWCVANDAFHNPSADDNEPWIAVEIRTGYRADAELIAHAPTDLAAALKVIEAVNTFIDHYGPENQRDWDWLAALVAARDEFEALS